MSGCCFVGSAAEEYLNRYRQITQNAKDKLSARTTGRDGDTEALSNIQQIIDTFPEYRHLSDDVNKHVSLVHFISQSVEHSDLLTCSELEQNIAISDENSSNSKNEFLRELKQLLQSSKISSMSKLRKKQKEKRFRFSKEKRGTANIMIETAKRTLTKSKMTDSTGFSFLGFKQEVENVYTQHSPKIVSLLEKVLNGKLKANLYPSAPSIYSSSSSSLTSSSSSSSSQLACPMRIVFFQLGGTTYEEVSQLQKYITGSQLQKLIIGGTSILNTKSFLADIAQAVTVMNPVE
jgi:vacuolar protein sorting-associated protein 45